MALISCGIVISRSTVGATSVQPRDGTSNCIVAGCLAAEIVPVATFVGDGHATYALPFVGAARMDVLSSSPVPLGHSLKLWKHVEHSFHGLVEFLFEPNESAFSSPFRDVIFSAICAEDIEGNRYIAVGTAEQDHRFAHAFQHSRLPRLGRRRSCR